MPNWVHNEVTFAAPNERLDQIADHIADGDVCFSFQQILPLPPEQSENWYQWRLTNWGTKWDASEPYLSDSADGERSYRFNTAWSPPVAVLESLSGQFPDVTMTISFEEEQGWGGIVEFANGQGKLIEDWDIPQSHADHVARGVECVCARLNGDAAASYFYEDCIPAVVERVTGTMDLDPAVLHALGVLLQDWTGTVAEAIEAAKRLVTKSPA